MAGVAREGATGGGCVGAKEPPRGGPATAWALRTGGDYCAYASAAGNKKMAKNKKGSKNDLRISHVKFTNSSQSNIPTNLE